MAAGEHGGRVPQRGGQGGPAPKGGGLGHATAIGIATRRPSGPARKWRRGLCGREVFVMCL